MDYAIKSIKMHADSGDVNAMLELGNCYFNGCGVERDKKKAKDLWYQAAGQGCEKAEKALADNFK